MAPPACHGTNPPPDGSSGSLGAPETTVRELVKSPSALPCSSPTINPNATHQYPYNPHPNLQILPTGPNGASSALDGGPVAPFGGGNPPHNLGSIQPSQQPLASQESGCAGLEQTLSMGFTVDHCVLFESKFKTFAVKFSAISK